MSTNEICIRYNEKEKLNKKIECRCYDCIIKIYLKKNLNFTKKLGGTLIILPKSLISNWKTEIQKLLKDRLSVYVY